MNQRIEKQFRLLETERTQLFQELRKYSDELINKKPAPEKWSVAEVIAHLITAEEMSLKYLQKKTLDTSLAKPESLKNKFRWLLVNIVFTFNIKFKAPEIVEPRTGYQTLAELETKWSEVRQGIYEILDKLNDNEVNSTLWKHAIAGKMNIFHMVEFFSVHFGRHRLQIERTLKIVEGQ
ncbi:MAG: DinB family protein [Chitinophagales bacterium]|nr:DinB family protein [Chitinophagales bacterium]